MLKFALYSPYILITLLKKKQQEIQGYIGPSKSCLVFDRGFSLKNHITKGDFVSVYAQIQPLKAIFSPNFSSINNKDYIFPISVRDLLL